jgi:hypothetical protein
MSLQLGAATDFFRSTFHYGQDIIGRASEAEAAEILEQAREFRRLIEDWIAANYPQLAP